MVKTCSSGARQQVLKNVQDENNWEKWNSAHWEVSAANANKYNLTNAMRRIASPGGVDETLQDYEGDEGTYSISSDEN